MKFFSFVVICSVLFVGCKETPKQERTESCYETVIEYENQYNSNGLLQRVVEREYEKISSLRSLLSASEKLFFYKNGALVKTEEYWLDKEGGRELYEEVFYTKMKKLDEEITLRNGDTVRHFRTEYDDKGRDSRRLRKLLFSLSQSRIDTVDNWDERMWYDDDGMLIKRIRRDFAGNTLTESSGNSEIITDLSTGKKTTVRFTEKQLGDTLMEERYVDDKLEMMWKTLKKEGIEYSWYYDGDRKLITRHECTFDGDERKTSYTFGPDNAIDSSFFENGKAVRNVVIHPDSHRETMYTYDSHGNPIKEETLIKMYDLKKR